MELAGIGPCPFCAMMHADMGAEVLLIDQPHGSVPHPRQALLNRGRGSVMLDLRNSLAVDIQA
jgi:crotonobetainyl-CoA:carnitine CoA-transferase CaiB-like acyl-CoA transferase